MIRRFVIALSTALPLVVPLASQSAAAATPSWHSYADCAVSYRLDALDKQLNRQRPPGMQAMIIGQSRDYENAAVQAYARTHHASDQISKAAVRSYMRHRNPHFAAMRKAGRLEHFIDACPQLPSQ